MMAMLSAIVFKKENPHGRVKWMILSSITRLNLFSFFVSFVISMLLSEDEKTMREEKASWIK